jgi:hypothetical protein
VGIDYTETSSSSITWLSTPNSTDGLTFITNLSTTNSTTDTSAITHSEDSTTYNLATYLQELDESTITQEPATWYVDPTGSDTTGDGSVGNPFATLQKAWDNLPDIIAHQQTIQLADGTYSDSSIPSGDQPRPAVLWGKGKVTTFRSWIASGEVNAAIVIKGNDTTPSNVKIQTGSDYNYGVYINKGNIGLQSLQIESNGADSSTALLVAHRTDTYIHTYNVIIDGKSVTTSGMNAESSGQIEFGAGDYGEIKNCTVGAQTLTSGDNIVISSQGTNVINNCGTGVTAVNNSYIGLFSAQDLAGKVEIIDSTCTTAINATFNSMIQVRGQDFGTDMAQIAAPVLIESGAHVEFIFAESKSTVSVKNASVKYNASNYQDVILAYNSKVHLETSNSYISPATANDNARPIQLLGDSTVFQEGTNNINGSGGLTVPTVFPSALTATANSQVLTPVQHRYTAVRVSSSAGGPWTGCEIDSTDVPEGKVMSVTFNNDNTNNIELIGTGTHMLFTDNITLGKTSGHYTGATFQMVDGKWRLTGLGQLIA